jgi:hypothetical protein
MAAPANFVVPYYLGRSYLPQPDRFDRRGGLYERATIERGIVRAINAGAFFKGKAKVKAEDIDSATSLLDEANDRFTRSLDRFVNLQKDIADSSRKASGEIRKATDSLAQGVARIEKQADFARLERYVELLERAAGAMQVLASLEQQGRLDKIAGALR